MLFVQTTRVCAYEETKACMNDRGWAGMSQAATSYRVIPSPVEATRAFGPEPLNVVACCGEHMSVSKSWLGWRCTRQDELTYRCACVLAGVHLETIDRAGKLAGRVSL